MSDAKHSTQEPAKPDSTATSNPEVEVRLWPAGVLIAAQLFCVFLLPLLRDNDRAGLLGRLGSPPLVTVALIVWWLGFSRIPWQQRWQGLLAFAGLTVVGYVLQHPSHAFHFFMAAMPSGTTLAILVLYVRRSSPWSNRRWFAGAAFAIGLFGWTLTRLDGITGTYLPEVRWRWAASAEDELLRSERDSTTRVAVPPDAESERLVVGPGDWPAFRGPRRDGRLTGVSIARDWPDGSPREVWRKRIGPGWSSFSVIGDRIFTQEQRGESELVLCYDADSGEVLWQHADQVRFSDPFSGAGPRATPTFAGGFLHSAGASGTVNCLNAVTGEQIWQRDLAADTTAKIPMWGFSASPLVYGDLVIHFAGGANSQNLIAYDTATGEVRWKAGRDSTTLSYSSPQLFTFGGEDHVVQVDDYGLVAFAPESGEQLWAYEWDVAGNARCTQACSLDDGSLLIGTVSRGTRRVAVKKSAGQWSTDVLWETRDLKPYFNDMVVFEGAIFGFDGKLLCCIDAETGRRNWRTRGYENGQVLVIADQKLLVVLAESGDLGLLEANAEEVVEVVRFHALDGKTWNHPVIAGGRLFVRNGTEMACYLVEERESTSE